MKQFISLTTLLLVIIFAVGSGSAVAQTATVQHGLRFHKHLRNGTSTNWAGYAAETNLSTPASNAVSEVSGSWVVPTINCAARGVTSYSSGWVGIDGYSDNTVEQTGTEQDCQRGRAQYYAWYEFYPQSELSVNSVAVHPGDTMSGDVKYAGNNTFTVTISDKTSGRSFSISRQMNSAQRQSAEWIAEAPSSWFGVLPLANFASMNFMNSSATIDGHTGTISDPAWKNDPLSMVTSSNQPKATVSALSSNGSGFGVTWQHN